MSRRQNPWLDLPLGERAGHVHDWPLPSLAFPVFHELGGSSASMKENKCARPKRAEHTRAFLWPVVNPINLPPALPCHVATPDRSTTSCLGGCERCDRLAFPVRRSMTLSGWIQLTKVGRSLGVVSRVGCGLAEVNFQCGRVVKPSETGTRSAR